MPTPKEEFEIDCREGETPKLEVYLYDENDNALAQASISSLVVTLTNEDGDVINSRNGQSVLDANQGDMHATSGLFTMQFTTDDTQIEAGRTEDTHTAKFLVTTTGSPARKKYFDCKLRIREA